MNELDILFPFPADLQVGGETIPVTPLRVCQFAPMMRAMQPVMTAFRFDSQQVDIDALMKDPNALRIVALGIGRDDSFVAGLKRNQQLNALLLVLGTNPDFFFPEAADDVDEADRGHELVDAFQRLISTGHRWPDIQDYTLAQIRIFGEASARLYRESDRMALLTARAAWTDSAVFKGVLNELGGVGNGQQ